LKTLSNTPLSAQRRKRFHTENQFPKQCGKIAPRCAHAHDPRHPPPQTCGCHLPNGRGRPPCREEAAR
jgi:hypothetical protein